MIGKLCSHFFPAEIDCDGESDNPNHYSGSERVINYRVRQVLLPKQLDRQWNAQETGIPEGANKHEGAHGP